MRIARVLCNRQAGTCRLRVHLQPGARVVGGSIARTGHAARAVTGVKNGVLPGRAHHALRLRSGRYTVTLRTTTRSVHGRHAHAIRRIKLVIR